MGTDIIQKVNELLVKEEAINKAIAKNFNIYKILGIESKETYICRAIASLLDDNYHNQGNCFLELFFKYVLGREYKDNNYKIITEETIDNYRRIDIVIKSNDEYIPIEAKIYAGDQQSQCYDYYKWTSKKEGDKAKVYYLTLDGHLPSKESVKDLEAINGKEDENNKNDNIVIGYKGIVCISFRKHILDWLSECLKCDCAIRIDNIRNMILQLDENIRELTGTNVNLNSKIQYYFNCNNIEEVYCINTETNTLKFKIRKKIFEIIMNYYGIKETKGNGDIDIRKVDERYPYIRFKIGNEKENNINIWFSIEINEETGRLWVGINCSKGISWFDAIKEGYYKKFIKKEVNSDEWYTSDRWLLNKTVEGSPDFRNLVKVEEWWEKENIEKLLNEIDRIKDDIKEIYNNKNIEQFPQKVDYDCIESSLTLNGELDNIKSKIKIAEAFEDYKFKFQNEWRNFIANKIKNATKSDIIDNVKYNNNKLVDNLFFKIYDRDDFNILFDIERGGGLDLIITDKNYEANNTSTDANNKKKKFELFNGRSKKIKINNNTYTNYDKGWVLLKCNENNILNSDIDFVNKYKYMNIGECQNIIEDVINDIKYFKEELNKSQCLSDNQNN